MPSRYVLRSFAENDYCHVFNRGVEQRMIFLDEQDYNIFMYYLFVYVALPEKIATIYPKLPLRLRSKNLSEKVDLLAYCLMPNHFHLLLRLQSVDAISRLMKQLTNAYTFYFNEKYKRVGSLLQGRFKAVRIPTDELLLHISRYIHLNPLVAGLVADLTIYPWSSYMTYTNPRRVNEDIVKTSFILPHFPSTVAYAEFVQDQADYAKSLHLIKHSTVEE